VYHSYYEDNYLRDLIYLLFLESQNNVYIYNWLVLNSFRGLPAKRFHLACVSYIFCMNDLCAVLVMLKNKMLIYVVE